MSAWPDPTADVEQRVADGRLSLADACEILERALATAIFARFPVAERELERRLVALRELEPKT